MVGCGATTFAFRQQGQELRSKESLEWSWWARARGDGGEWVTDRMPGDSLSDGAGAASKAKQQSNKKKKGCQMGSGETTTTKERAKMRVAARARGAGERRLWPPPGELRRRIPATPHKQADRSPCFPCFPDDVASTREAATVAAHTTLMGLVGGVRVLGL